MRRAAVVLAVLLAARLAAAAGYQVAEQGAIASSTGGAGTARDDDPAAAWYNPAALADGGGLRLTIGAMAASSVSYAEGASGDWRFQTVHGPSAPPHLYASWATGPMAAGIALLVPFGGGVTWPAEWVGRYEVVASRLVVLRAAPFFAVRAGPVRLSAGVHFDRGMLAASRKLAIGDVDGDVRLDLRGTAVGWHGSIFFAPGPHLALGVAYKGRTTIPLAGDADFTLPGDASPDQQVLSEIRMPDRVAVGVRARLGPVALVADSEIVWWGVNERLFFDFAKRSTPDSEQRNGWHRTVSLRGGIEVARRGGFTARAGAFYDPTPVPDETVGPSAPDGLRTGFTFGIGQRLGGGWTMDLFYEMLKVAERRAPDDAAVDATYGGGAYMMGVGLSYRQPASRRPAAPGRR